MGKVIPSNAHAHTVMCPSCKRMWTGLFISPFPETEICKDCIAEGEGKAKESKDLVISGKL